MHIGRNNSRSSKEIIARGVRRSEVSVFLVVITAECDFNLQPYVTIEKNAEGI